MEAMRESWTDARLDDFREEVGKRFDRIEAELRMQRLELSSLRQEMNAGFESLQRLVLQVGGGIIATFAIGVFTVLAAG
ncbi:MAG TPA: hypothetical protein VF259_01445 [Solirubrobacterales bacterium]